MISSLVSAFIFVYLFFSLGYKSFNINTWDHDSGWAVGWISILLGLVIVMCRFTPQTVGWF